jgi:hypothetical protein
MVLFGCGGAGASPATSATAPGGEGGDPKTTAAAEGTGSSMATGDGSEPAGAEASESAKVPVDPYADMPHPPETDSGRHQLSAADVKQMVELYRPHMRELCWLPRVNDTPKGPDTVRVAIQVDVAKSGEVTSLKAAGGQQYEGLGSCVEEHVKRWRFPKAQQASSLMFPIVFNRGESKLIQVE